jgi:hypothetical protein
MTPYVPRFQARSRCERGDQRIRQGLRQRLLILAILDAP